MKLSRAHRVALRNALGLVGVVVILFLAVSGGQQSSPVVATAPVQWSEQFGGGEVFPACASSALPVNPIVCVANVGQTCYLSNSCGQKSPAGVIGCDGTCGNRYETTKLTPSGRFLSTYDDFRNGPADVCSALVGKPAVAGNAYACAPNLNIPGYCDGENGCFPPIYYAEARHNGGWGSYTYGQGWCEETGVQWVECGPALVAPPESSCPTTPVTLTTDCPPPQTMVNGMCVTVDPPRGAPTASITANPLSVAYNGRSTLTWSSTNATSCMAGGAWSNQGTFSGNGLTDSLTTATTFTFQCTGPGGTSPLSSATVAVRPETCDNGTNNPRACDQCPDGQAYRSEINACGDCDNGGCSSGPGGGGSVYNNPTGSLVCNNGANNPYQCNAYTPTATLSANPRTVDVGQSSTLTWSSTNATSCTGSGFTAGGTSGSRSTGSLNTPGTVPFTLTCTGPGGTSIPASDSVTVLDPSAAISVSPARVPAGSTAQVSWSASGVSSCTVSGPSGTFASGPSDEDTFSFPAGSRSVIIEGQSTFIITCETNGAPVIRSAMANILTIFEEF